MAFLSAGELGAEAAADLAEAMELGQQRFGWAKDRMPRLAMGHSLGAKLQALRPCYHQVKVIGTSYVRSMEVSKDLTLMTSVPWQVLLCCQQPDPMLSGVALLAFNNFGVEDQVRDPEHMKQNHM